MCFLAVITPKAPRVVNTPLQGKVNLFDTEQTCTSHRTYQHYIFTSIYFNTTMILLYFPDLTV